MDINKVELFRTGRWNDIKNFTEQDLDGMVSSFAELAMAGRVPLKFGHNQKQPFTDGQPALGWVSRLWREDEKLFADFTSMPRVVYDAVKDGIYKFVSIELLRDVAYDGKEFPWVLSAVALLGADIPAVRGLRDLQALAMSRGAALRSGARVTFTRDVSTSGDREHMADEKDKPNLDALTARLDALTGKVETFSQENATLKAENKRLTDEAVAKEKERKKERVEGHRAAIALRFKTAINGKLILPSTQERFERDPAFKSDDGVLDIKLESVDSFIKENHVPGAKQPAAGGGGEHQVDDTQPADVQVRELTFHEMASNQMFAGKSYSEANQHVLKTHPELAEAYRNQPGTTGGRA